MISIAHQDRPRSEKTDAGNDLCPRAQRIVGKAEPIGNEQSGDHGRRRADADENVRAQAGRTAMPLALQPDRTAKKRRNQQPEDTRHRIKLPQTGQ